MAGLGHLSIKIFSVLAALLLSEISLYRGHAYPADENIMGENEAAAYPLSYAYNFQQESSPHHNHIDKPKGCFHFYVSRNMSSLLSDATKMLQQVRDRREREWILTFIYRIKSLAEHLRSHPESRNYDCLSSDDDNRRRNSPLGDRLRIPQQELYFVDDLQSNHNKRSGNSEQAQSPETEGNPPVDNQQSSTGASREQSSAGVPQDKGNQNFNSVAEPSSTHAVEPVSSKTQEQDRDHLTDSIPTTSAAIHSELNDNANSYQPKPDEGASQSTADDTSSEGKQSYDNVIVISSPPDCEQNAQCEEALNRHIAANGLTAGDSDDLLVQELHSRQHEKNIEEDRIHQKALKKRIRKALLEEMAPEVKKLRTVGGTEEDLINLWKQSENDNGKSTDSYYDGDFDYEENGAAAGDLNSNEGMSPNDQTVAPSLRDMKNFKRQSGTKNGSGTKAYEPYDDSDVLVKQLFDVRFEQTPSKTTKSLSDQQEEYLITSTHIPY